MSGKTTGLLATGVYGIVSVSLFCCVANAIKVTDNFTDSLYFASALSD